MLRGRYGAGVAYWSFNRHLKAAPSKRLSDSHCLCVPLLPPSHSNSLSLPQGNTEADTFGPNDIAYADAQGFAGYAENACACVCSDG